MLSEKVDSQKVIVNFTVAISPSIKSLLFFLACAKISASIYLERFSKMIEMHPKIEPEKRELQTEDFYPIKKRFDQNPFLCSPRTKVKNKIIGINRGISAVSNDTGEIVGGSYLFSVEEYDEEEYVKIYPTEIFRWLGLGKNTQKVFGAILKIVSKEAINKDFIFLNHQRVIEQSGKISEPSFYKGINQLVEEGLIAKAVSNGLYWINPAVFFNGDRLTFARQIRIKRAEQEKTLANNTENPSP